VYSHLGEAEALAARENRNGQWMNTWMNGDEASWIDSTALRRDRFAARQFDRLLGEAPYPRASPLARTDRPERAGTCASTCFLFGRASAASSCSATCTSSCRQLSGAPGW